jgi:YbbR domain-containing protein
MIAFLRHLFFHDFWLKLFSLALAVLLWLVVNFAIQKKVSPAAPLNLMRAEQRIFSRLPVVIMSSAEDVRSFRVDPKEVDITVLGEPGVLNTVNPKDIHALVDLTGIEAAHDLRARIEVSTPAGVTYVRVQPEEVQVIFPPRNP